MKESSLKDSLKEHSPSISEESKDYYVKREEADLKRRHFSVYEKSEAQRIKNLESDRKLRIRITWSICGFALAWFIFVSDVVSIHMFHDRVHIDKWPLSVLIGSTAANVFACFIAITNGVFKIK